MINSQSEHEGHEPMESVHNLEAPSMEEEMAGELRSEVVSAVSEWKQKVKPVLQAQGKEKLPNLRVQSYVFRVAKDESGYVLGWGYSPKESKTDFNQSLFKLVEEELNK